MLIYANKFPATINMTTPEKSQAASTLTTVKGTKAVKTKQIYYWNKYASSLKISM